MKFQIRLVSIWRFIVLSTLLTMIIEFSLIIITKAQWYPLIYGILVFGALYLSVIVGSLLSSRTKIIEISDGTIIIDNIKRIQIDSIEWYFQDENYLFDGIRIKTNDNKNFYFTTINFVNKDSNFELLKDIMNKKSIENNIPIKTNDDLIKDSKTLRYGSTIALVFLGLIIVLTIFTDFKIDTVKIIYVSMIIIGTFIATRK